MKIGTIADLIEHRSRNESALAAASRLFVLMADPRGRCNRKAFLHIALAFLALQFGVAALLWLADIEVDRTATYLMNAPLFWIGTTVCIKRLHDVGRSGWWLPGAFAVWFVFACVIGVLCGMMLPADSLEAGQLGFLFMFGVVTLPLFGALIWLHTAPSIGHSYRFGPEPSGFGLSTTAGRRRTRPVRTFYASAVLA